MRLGWASRSYQQRPPAFYRSFQAEDSGFGVLEGPYQGGGVDLHGEDTGKVLHKDQGCQHVHDQRIREGIAVQESPGIGKYQ